MEGNSPPFSPTEKKRSSSVDDKKKSKKPENVEKDVDASASFSTNQKKNTNNETQTPQTDQNNEKNASDELNSFPEHLEENDGNASHAFPSFHPPNPIFEAEILFSSPKTPLKLLESFYGGPGRTFSLKRRCWHLHCRNEDDLASILQEDLESPKQTNDTRFMLRRVPERGKSKFPGSALHISGYPEDASTSEISQAFEKENIPAMILNARKGNALITFKNKKDRRTILKKEIKIRGLRITKRVPFEENLVSLFIGNVDFSLSSIDLWNLIDNELNQMVETGMNEDLSTSIVEDINNVVIPFSKKTGRQQPFAFITVSSFDAFCALMTLNGREINGREIFVTKAINKKSKQENEEITQVQTHLKKQGKEESKINKQKKPSNSNEQRRNDWEKPLPYVTKKNEKQTIEEGKSRKIIEDFKNLLLSANKTTAIDLLLNVLLELKRSLTNYTQTEEKEQSKNEQEKMKEATEKIVKETAEESIIKENTSLPNVVKQAELNQSKNEKETTHKWVQIQSKQKRKKKANSTNSSDSEQVMNKKQKQKKQIIPLHSILPMETLISFLSKKRSFNIDFDQFRKLEYEHQCLIRRNSFIEACNINKDVSVNTLIADIEYLKEIETLTKSEDIPKYNTWNQSKKRNKEEEQTDQKKREEEEIIEVEMEESLSSNKRTASEITFKDTESPKEAEAKTKKKGTASKIFSN